MAPKEPMTTNSTIENDPPRGDPLLADATLLRSEPDRNCPLCPRLADFVRRRGPANRTGSIPWVAVVRRSRRSAADRRARARLQGANRTGRPFTGDYAGDLLCDAARIRLCKGNYQARPDDGLTLVDCRISNAVHCVPPQNKPLPRKSTPAGSFSSRRSRTCRACARSWRSAGSRMKSTLKALGLRPAAARLRMARCIRPAR